MTAWIFHFIINTTYHKEPPNYFCLMSANSFGTLLRLTSFGESHGPAIGGILEGMPSEMPVDLEKVQTMLDARSPGRSDWVSPRRESDKVEFLSGILEGKTLGTPIGFIIRNRDAKSVDYQNIKDVYRPSHADFSWEAKFGIRDFRGGGRSSARETACRVVGGALALQFLENLGIKITAWVSQIGEVTLTEIELPEATSVHSSEVRCPDPETAKQMIEALARAHEQRDSLGGMITCVATGVPAGWGEPVFDKLHAEIGKAMLSINAVKAFEIGGGFSSAHLRGSQNNDAIVNKQGRIRTKTNNSGGIQGGISNGEDIRIKVAFKPIASIGLTQETVNTSGAAQKINIEGRHDVCVVPRATPIVESMLALVLADMYLRARTNRLGQI